MSTTLLAGDIGGTKTLLSLYSWDGIRLERHREQRFASADWQDLAPMVRRFLADGDASDQPAAACFAVAGPVQAGQARLTNLPWRLSESRLAADCGIPQVALVNDFAVLVHGLPHLGPEQLAPIRPGSADPQEPRLILGAGTGLGVALGIPTGTGLRAMATEAAHAEFAPRNPAEWSLRQWLQHDLALERVSIERVVSGTGLGHVARWLLHERDPQGGHPLQDVARRWWRGMAPEGLATSTPTAGAPASGAAGEAERVDLPAAVAAAAQQGDPLATETMALWLSAYGSVVGDLALTSLSHGGIWLAGGTAAKLLTELRSGAFEEAFLAKGRLRPALEPMPIQAVIDPQVGAFSAACRAMDLVA